MLTQSNKVELIGTYGDDLSHACSAWTSTSRDLTEDKKSRIDKLLLSLAQNGHETPFEKSSLHFLVTTDIATHIQLLKHRIGVSVNAESARYKELKEDKAVMPDDWPADLRARYGAFVGKAFDEYHKIYQELLTRGFDKKRAKESARFVLPYGNQITADIMFNFRSFIHFLNLRYSAHAQKEIRELARQMAELVWKTGKFQESLLAFGVYVKNDKDEVVLREP